MERAEASQLRDRIQGEGSSRKSSKSSKRRYVVDEDAFYNQRDDAEGNHEKVMSEKKASSKQAGGYDRQEKEPNLARKLGLEEEHTEKSKEELEKEQKRKKNKEELEKEKEIDEVRKIIESGSNLNKYIKEVDLLGTDIGDSNNSPIGGKGAINKNGRRKINSRRF